MSTRDATNAERRRAVLGLHGPILVLGASVRPDGRPSRVRRMSNMRTTCGLSIRAATSHSRSKRFAAGSKIATSGNLMRSHSAISSYGGRPSTSET